MQPTELPITEVFESKTNPRKHFDPGKLAELAASAKAHGILEPLLVRPHNGKHEIVAGARRYRAAKIAELTMLPVRVMELTDQQVLETQLIENLQREDPHPLEESEGYARLLKLDGYTAEVLAEKVGKTPSYIYKRLQLAHLIKPAKDAFLENRINIGHALFLCRLPESSQKPAFEQCFPSSWNGSQRVHDTKDKATFSAKELANWIRDNILLELSAAPWKKDDANLLPKAGPCTTCAKRTGSNAALFDDFKKGDQCLDGACYERKRDAFVKLQVKAAPDLPQITMEYGGLLPAGVLSRDRFHPIKNDADKCKHTEPAIVSAGEQQVGHKILICKTAGCKKHGQFRSNSFGKERGPAEQWAERRKKLDARIELETKQAVWREVIASVPEEFNRPEMEFVGQKLIDRAGNDGRRALCSVLSLEGEKHKNYGGVDFEAPLVAHMKNLAEKDLPGFLVGISLFGSLAFHDTGLDEMAKLYDVDVKAAEKAIGQPLIEKFEASKAKALTKTAPEKKGKKAKAAAK
jgi:ParB family chromosome partitioning protein